MERGSVNTLPLHCLNQMLDHHPTDPISLHKDLIHWWTEPGIITGEIHPTAYTKNILAG